MAEGKVAPGPGGTLAPEQELTPNVPTFSDFVEKERSSQTFAFVVLTAEALFTSTLT